MWENWGFDFSGGEPWAVDFSGGEPIGPAPWEGFDPGAGENLGAYDFGALDMPRWAGWNPGLVAPDFPAAQEDWALGADEARALGEDWTLGAEEAARFFPSNEGLLYNTTTRAVSGPGGVPGAVAGTAGAAAQVAQAVRGAPGQRPAGSAPAPTGPPQGFMGTLDRFLGTNLGRAAGAAGVGALGLGIQQALAGGTAKYRPPTYTPSPVTQAGQTAVLRALEGPAGPALTEAMTAGVMGQRDIAQQVAGRVGREAAAEEEMAPAERGIRMASLADIQRLMVPGAEAPVVDPIEQAIREELLGVLTGGGTGVSPMTARRQQLEEQEVRARLYKQLGPDYELTTPGIQTLNEMRQRQTSEQFTERQATIARLSPLEESRRRFTTTAPSELLTRREGLRRANLGDVVGLSRFGIRGTPENLTALGSIAPVQTYLGADPERANLINTQLQAGAAQAAFGAESQRRRDLARGVGDVAGIVAGSVAARPSRLEDYYSQVLANRPRRYDTYGTELVVP